MTLINIPSGGSGDSILTDLLNAADDGAVLTNQDGEAVASTTANVKVNSIEAASAINSATVASGALGAASEDGDKGTDITPESISTTDLTANNGDGNSVGHTATEFFSRKGNDTKSFGHDVVAALSDGILIANGTNNISEDYATPVMTAGDAPSPCIVTATSYTGINYPWKAFTQSNINLDDSWVSLYDGGALPQAIMFYWGGAKKCINKYAFLSRNHFTNEWPTNWYFQCALDNVEIPDVTDNSHWRTLERRSDSGWPGVNMWSEYFTFTNYDESKAIRILINSATQNTYVAIGTIKLIEAA